ncbi:hypothetical protein R3O67_34030 [Bacillus cereus]|uniref:hypothetical protein n=1 Tax=Bacillus cereus TaxID=1396 RepID=UPI00307A71F8
MISGLLCGLLLGWFLSWFGFDEIVSNGLNELFKLKTTESTYYLIFAVGGMIYGAVNHL